MAKAMTRKGKTAAGDKAARTGGKSRRSTKKADKADNEAPSVYRQQLGRLGREAILFAAAAVTLFLLAALISYNPADPGWARQGSGLAVHNLLGVPGAWIADVLLSLFGYLGFIAPLLVLYSGWLAFVNRDLRSDEFGCKSIRAVALLLSLLAACALAWLLFGGLVPGSLPQGSGGLFGLIMARPVAGVINILGAAWLFVTVFLIALSIGLGFSWLNVAERIGHFVLDGAQNTASALSDWIAAWRAERAEQSAAHKDKSSKRQHRSRGQRRSSERREPKLAETPKTTSSKAKVAKGKAAKTNKPARQASQLDLPMDDSGIEVPTYDSERDSPIPPITLLDPARAPQGDQDDKILDRMSEQLEGHLADFNVQAKVVAALPGPVVTRFEIDPAPGVKVNQITNLAKDLARAMSTTSVRVVEVIPGKSVVGLEIPNANREVVALREILDSPRYADSKAPLTVALGKDIGGAPVTANLAKMPHLLVAGTTGSGKSVGVNAMILSILHKSGPEQVRLILIDPKMLELSVYEGIPHLLAPVVTDMKNAANALRWCVGEMERRYKLMAALGVRNMAGFNTKVQKAIDAGQPIADPIAKNAQSNEAAEAGEALPTLEPLPAIVIVVDELADMMMVVGKKVEELIARIAQKARAAGLHMILATQRPSVDVITGLIKANIPTRIAFQVASKIDSRTILDQQGAESLLGHGDMLYLPPGTGFSTRVHGAFVDDHEVHKVVEYLKQTGQPDYIDDILEGGQSEDGNGSGDAEDAESDPLYDQAVAIVLKSRKASISYVQRRLRVGYNRSARLIEQMENAGIVSPAEGGGGREVLAPAPPDDD
jgi:S-DNA-T family DNA segregation ATPase FtsK/SpoIIIE